MKGNQPKVTILGAGVVGFSTALCIQDSLPRAHVTLVADKFNQDTLSDGAGGLFRPELNIAPTPELGLTWYKDSYDHYMDLIRSVDSYISGCQIVSGFHLSSISQELTSNQVLKALVPGQRKLLSEDLAIFPTEFKYGTFYTTVVTDCHKYLPWMKQKFEDRGGIAEFRHIDSLEEFGNICDILINCSGLEAKRLASDFKVTPIRGQTIRIKAPWIKHFYFGNESYIIPGQEQVTLGAIKTYGSYDTGINLYDRRFIWETCTRLVPSIQRSEVVGDWVGLRPFRQPVRVEAEIKRSSVVVHNYGHGGHGVSLSWGTAKHATHLVMEILKGYTSSHL